MISRALSRWWEATEANAGGGTEHSHFLVLTISLTLKKIPFFNIPQVLPFESRNN
jgi:hypothetical protein